MDISQTKSSDIMSENTQSCGSPYSALSDTQKSVAYECIDILHQILHKEKKLQKHINQSYSSLNENYPKKSSVQNVIKQIDSLLREATQTLENSEFHTTQSDDSYNKELKKNYEKLQLKYSRLKEKLSRREELQEDVRINSSINLNASLDFDTKVLDLQNKVISLQTCLAKTESDNRDLKSKIVEIDEHNSYLEGIIYNLRHDIRLKYPNTNLKPRGKDVATKKEKNLSELAKKHHELKIKAMSYKNTIEELRNANSCLENRLKSQDNTQLREALIHSEGMNQGMKTSLDALERRLAEIEKDNAELNRENATLSQQVEVLQHTLDANAAFNGQMNTLMKRNAELEELLLQAKEEYGKKTLELEDRLDGKESDIEEKDRQISILQSALEQSHLDKIESHIVESDGSEIFRLKSDLESAQNEISRKDDEIQHLKILHREELLKLEEEHAKEIERLKSNRNSEELYRETIAGQQERIEHLVRLLTRSEEVIATLRALASGDATQNSSYESKSEEEEYSEIKTPINGSKSKSTQGDIFNQIAPKKLPTGIIKKTQTITDSYIDRLCEEKQAKVKIIQDKHTQGAVLERKPSSAYFKETETPRIIRRGYVEPDLKRELEEMQAEIAQIKAEINESGMAPSMIKMQN